MQRSDLHDFLLSTKPLLLEVTKFLWLPLFFWWGWGLRYGSRTNSIWITFDCIWIRPFLFTSEILLVLHRKAIVAMLIFLLLKIIWEKKFWNDRIRLRKTKQNKTVFFVFNLDVSIHSFIFKVFLMKIWKKCWYVSFLNITDDKIESK